MALVALFLAAGSLVINGVVLQSLRPLAAQGAPIHPETPREMSWREIESADPTVYAANLRALGCPETAIAAVLASSPAKESRAEGVSIPQPVEHGPEVARPDAVPASPRSDVVNAAGPVATVLPVAVSDPAMVAENFSNGTVAARTTNRPAGLSPATRSNFTRPAGGAFPGRVASNPGAERASPSAPTSIPSTSAGSGTNADDLVITAPQGDVNIPAAFATSATERLSPAQQQQITQLQDQFVSAIGGAGQDPTDPAYQQAWQTAQWKSDQIYRALFGHQAWLDRQFEANRHATD